jgi:sugar transferase EpsL
MSHSRYQRVKRIADECVAGLALVAFVPLMLVISLAIWMCMGRPILFTQKRPGLHERTFVCLKFRTMNYARDRSGQLLPDEVRLTPLGKLLRCASLDELPQLWNILCGDLSFVGPRPLLEDYLPFYTAMERRRHLVRPGLTGWAQINGRNRLSFDERLALDVWYVDNVDWKLDLRIMFRTIWTVLSQQGVRGTDSSARLDVQRSIGNGTL